MGQQFRIVAKTDRYADMEGFVNDLTKERVQIKGGVAVTVDTASNKFLLGLRESPHLPHNKHSLLSTGQSHEFGVWVGDVLKRHGGDQCIRAQTKNGEIGYFELSTSQELLKLDLQYPTNTEMEFLPTVWLPSDKLWDPTVLDDETKLIIPVNDGGRLNLNNTNTINVVDQSNGFYQDLGQEAPLIKTMCSMLGIVALGRSLVRTMTETMRKAAN